MAWALGNDTLPSTYVTDPTEPLTEQRPIPLPLRVAARTDRAARLDRAGVGL